MRVLSWNLFHGRADPPAGRLLLPEFSAAIAGWDWEVALLQEVPPWWTAHLGRAAGASARSVLTSRNGLLPLRRFIAERWPDLIRSNGGGCNAILVRGQPIVEHRRRVLRAVPERRMMQGVRLGSGLWVVNLHGSTPPGPRSMGDWKLARSTALEWAGGGRVVLGGDLNLRQPAAGDGFRAAAGHEVDHVFVRGLEVAGPGEVLERPVTGGSHLSDHDPIVGSVGS